MAGSQLRVYYGPAEETTAAARPPKQNITLQTSEVLPLLADAVADRRAWLRDFCDDEMTISTDLYEVLLAYQYYRRPGA